MIGRLEIKVRSAVVLMALTLGVPLGWTQSIDRIRAQQEQRLEAAIERLKQQRQSIYDAQIPLAEALRERQAEVASLKKQLQERRGVRDTASLSLEQLEQQVNDRRRELNYITGDLFAEFAAALNAVLSPAELATYGETLRQHDLLLEQAEVSESEKLANSLEVLEVARSRAEGLLGGKLYSGEALGPDGRLIGGRFLQLGPLLYFSSSSGEAVGWIEETKGLQPRVRAATDDQAEAIQDVVQNGSGRLPVDPTLGDAAALAETRESWREHLRKGGVWVIPILLFAAVSLVVSVFKFVQIFSIRQPQTLVVHDIVKRLRQGDLQEALALASAQPQPAAAMLQAGVEHADGPIELVEEVMFESILSAQPRLERFLNVIAVTAATAPLLGLLGTVTGIIKTFKLMEVFGAGDPKPLISGISEALITTELGLVLAIPALIAHALLSRRVAGVLAQMEKLSVALVNGLARGGRIGGQASVAENSEDPNG